MTVMVLLSSACGDNDKGDKPGDPGRGEQPQGTNSTGSLAIDNVLEVSLASGNTVVAFDAPVLPADGSATAGSLAIESAALALQTANVPKTNVMAVDSSGKGYVPFISDYDIDVLFSALHPSGKELFMALNSNREAKPGEHNPKSTSALISNLNCSLLRISLVDSSRKCVRLGLAVETAPYGHLQRDRKPIQFDGVGNVYFLAGEFDRCSGPGGQGKVTHENPAENGENLDFCGGIELPQIYRMDYATGEVKAITQDTSRVSFFAVLKSGEVVYQVRDLTEKISGFGSPAVLSMYKDGATVNLSGKSPVGISFFATDDERTMLWGDQDDSGIRLARVLDDNRVTSAIVLNQDVGKRPFGNYIPSAISVMNGDDGKLYAIYEKADPSLAPTEHHFAVMQLMPYSPTPIVTIESSKTWLDWVEGRNVQIARGSVYYVENVDLKDGYGFRDVIRVVKASDRSVTTLLADAGSRFEVYNWQLNNDVLTFSGVDLTNTKVVIGTIQVDLVQQGKSAAEYLAKKEVASAASAQSQIQDIEVLLPIASETDPGGDTKVDTLSFDPDTPLTLSLAFNKAMKRDTVLTALSLIDAQGQAVEALPMWVGQTLHLVPDVDGLFGMDQTTKLTAGASYTLSLGSGVKDSYGGDLGGTKSFNIAVSP
jgi:hypothetical protein